LYVSKSLYDDLRAVRHSQAEARKPYTVTRLTREGRPSKAHDATTRFATIEEAQAFIERVQQLNPNRNIRFTTNF